MSMGFVGCHREEIFKFDDDITVEEIEQELTEWVWTLLDAWYEEQQ